MFSLIRRISYGVIPRPDRPWEEDATSNAPARRRKRRLSSTERDSRDETEEIARGKKARSGSQSPEIEVQESRETPLPVPEAETKEVKEVTKGVEEVVLDEPSTNPDSQTDEQPAPQEAPTSQEEPSVAPESVPLPDGGSSELDDLADASGSEEEMVSEDEREPVAEKDSDVPSPGSKPDSDAPKVVATEPAPTSEEDSGAETLEEIKAADVSSKLTEGKPTTLADD